VEAVAGRVDRPLKRDQVVAEHVQRGRNLETLDAIERSGASTVLTGRRVMPTPRPVALRLL
jgi:hypothetical protein